MAQKSPPSGAPTRAAAASIAVMPGSTWMSSLRQSGIAVLEGFEHRRCHGEDARIAAGDNGDVRTLRREIEREARAIKLDPVVGGMAALARALGHAVDIGAVADEIGGGGKRLGRRRREPARIAGAEADDGERGPSYAPPLARHDDERKVGSCRSSGSSDSGKIFSSAMVARST